MNLGGFLDAKAQQPLPPVFEDHEPELYAFQKYCQTMMNKILDLFAVGLEVHLIPLPLSSKTAPLILTPPGLLPNRRLKILLQPPRPRTNPLHPAPPPLPTPPLKHRNPTQS
jgi:hypothetical protein